MNPDQSGFAEAVKAIMALPLTEAEKAEAVRRLLNDVKNRKPNGSAAVDL